MTPSEFGKIHAAVVEATAALLAREDNSERTAEELAEELASNLVETMVDTYEEIQAKSYNLVVVASFDNGDGTTHTAAVGPLSTRAKQRARDMGERFAWDYKTRRGTGKFALVPLIRNPSDAWDEARRDEAAEFAAVLTSITPGVEPSYEAMRLDLPPEVRQAISGDWSVSPEVLEKKFGPPCICGLTHMPERTNLGDPVTRGCPRHPNKE